MATTERLVMLIEAQNKDVMSKLRQIERQAKGTFDKSGQSAKRFSRDMNSAATSAKTFLAAFAGGFAGATVARIFDGLTSSATQAIPELSKLAKTADKVGVSIEDLQRLRFGFGLTGVDQAQSDTALQRFSRRIAQAAAGSGELYEIIKQNGVALREQDGSMRSSVDILRDYADLVKNAGSEQDRLLLAFKAFDTEGAGLVNALKGGSDGLDQLMGKINEAGGVLDSSLAREAERIEDEFSAMWQAFDTAAKRATINAVGYLGSVSNAIMSANRALNQSLMQVLPESLGKNLATAQLRDDLAGPFGLRDVNRGMFFRDAVGAPTSSPLQLTVRPRQTIIPKGGGKSGKSDHEKERDKVKSVIEALKLEQMQIGMTAQQKRVMNELRAAGSAATGKEKDMIEELVVSNEQAAARMEAITQATEFFQQQAMSAFSAVIGQIRTGNDALDQFLQTLIEVSAQALLFNSGPLAGLFGGGSGGGGGLSGLAGLTKIFGGFFANGGNLGAGKWGIAGEAGPEIIRGPATVVPMRSNDNRGGQVVNIAIDATGADAAGLARVEAQLSRLERGFDKRAVGAVNQQRSRGYVG